MRTALAACLAAAVLAAGCGGDDQADGPPPGSTLTATLVDRDGDGVLERGPGEALRDRDELGGAGRPGATLATFAQITDAHVRDEESPARVPFLDRLGGVFSPVFRPQEALTAQVLAATVRSLNRLHPQAVTITGDLADNAQANELDTARAVLTGGRVRPDSGAKGYDGVQEAGNPDPFYYRPDVDPPRHPGLLADAQRAFDAPGLDAPWYPVLGNHDLLAQGEAPPTPAIEAVATGDRMVESLDPGLRPAAGTNAEEAVAALLAGGDLPGRTRAVPADPARHLLSPSETLRRLGRRGRDGGRLDYSFDIGASLRGVVLDVVDRSGGERGLVTPAQVTWLRGELRRAGPRYVVVFSHQPLTGSDGGEAALRALDAAPRVVATIAGHRHRNAIAPRPSGPYWLVETASLADYPQQARFFRLVQTAGGGVALETWMVDHDGAGLARHLARARLPRRPGRQAEGLRRPAGGSQRPPPAAAVGGMPADTRRVALSRHPTRGGEPWRRTSSSDSRRPWSASRATPTRLRGRASRPGRTRRAPSRATRRAFAARHSHRTRSASATRTPATRRSPPTSGTSDPVRRCRSRPGADQGRRQRLGLLPCGRCRRPHGRGRCVRAALPAGRGPTTALTPRRTRSHQSAPFLAHRSSC